MIKQPSIGNPSQTMSDYSFMRSGFDLVASQPTLTSSERQAVLSVLLVFFEKALRDAAQYVAAAGRRAVQGKDIVRALKLQALPESGFWDTPDLEARVSAYAVDLAATEGETDSDCDCDSDVASSEGASDPDCRSAGSDGSDEAWTEAIAEGEGDIQTLCARMNAVEAAFEAWEPSTGIPAIVKEAITKTAEAFDA